MAVKMLLPDTGDLRAIVDMGSNGIRFSISSLQPPTARIMPTLYQSRTAISLYDAQYSASGERQPIDQATIDAVTSSFLQFRRTCEDFGVLKDQVVVLATEATRTAENSDAFRKQIKERVGWDVTMLPKEDEGRVGAMGIASSLPQLSGLVMDLGGGSTQLSWITKHAGSDEVCMPDSGAVSMPYGAAAMSRRLSNAERDGTVEELRREVQSAVKQAFESLAVPQALSDAANHTGGFTLYLSGGGFRGWGYVLMSKHAVQPYPVPIINGFSVDRQAFLGTEEVVRAAAESLQDDDPNIFRVSERRATQVPAVAFLVSALAEALPDIKEVRFCQGGVREGYLFSQLTSEVKSQHPLVVATEQFSTQLASTAIADLLGSSFPSDSSKGERDDYKSIFTPSLLSAFANLMYYHASHSKDLQASAALRSTTSGILAGVHGIQHEDRALLALLLCNRWGGDVPPSDVAFKQNLERLITSPSTLWWINYIGAVAAVVASVYPAGIRAGIDERVKLKSDWSQDRKGRSLLALEVTFAARVDGGAFDKVLEGIEKVGKKKRWIGGRDGAGHKIFVRAITGSG